MSTTCHFVYSVPSYKREKYFDQFGHKVKYKLYAYGLPVNIVGCRQPGNDILSQWPVQSPYENTKHIYIALSKLFSTYLYHSTERVKIKLKPDDIFLGHPYFPHTGKEKGVTEHAIHSKVRPQVLAMITPLHCDTKIKTTHINKAFLDHVNSLMPKVDVLFAIMGQYWWDQWDNSPYAHWKPKMVRLDMAVDVNYYPFIKKKFSEPGKRKFLYIGKNDPMKGIDFLQSIAEKMGNDIFGWIGAGSDINCVNHIASHIELKLNIIEKIASEYDFFISPSMADPNPTTILESMAWGFPVICTPQSGYYETSYRFNIHANKLNESVETLKRLQYASEDELIRISNEARQIVETDYTWERFTSTVIEHLAL